VTIARADMPILEANSLIRSILPRMQQELGSASDSGLLVTMLVAIVGLGVVIGAPVSAFLIRAVGRRAVAVWAIIVYVCLGCAPYFLSNLYVILVLSLILAMAGAAIQVVAVTTAGEFLNANRRARIIGIMIAATTFFAMVSTPLGGIVGEAQVQSAADFLRFI
jgi:predicted MFS family arabinose efflux permease